MKRDGETRLQYKEMDVNRAHLPGFTGEIANFLAVLAVAIAGGFDGATLCPFGILLD